MVELDSDVSSSTDDEISKKGTQLWIVSKSIRLVRGLNA